MNNSQNKAPGAVRRCLRHLTWLTTPDPDGDTIIEVMVVLAVLGLAVGICYATANRSLLNTRQAQENTIAATYVQSQIEALRTMATNTVSSGNDIFTQDQAFCINTTTAGSYTIVDSSNATTYKSPASSGGCQADSPPYTLGITYNSSANDPGTFTVTAQWPDVLGQGTDTVTEYYRLHGPAVATPAPSTPTPPPSGGGVSLGGGCGSPHGDNYGNCYNPCWGVSSTGSSCPPTSTGCGYYGYSQCGCSPNGTECTSHGGPTSTVSCLTSSAGYTYCVSTLGAITPPSGSGSGSSPPACVPAGGDTISCQILGTTFTIDCSNPSNQALCAEYE